MDRQKMISPSAARCLAMVLACGGAGEVSAAQPSNWLTVRGEPDDAANDIVDVNPESIQVKAELRTMQIRVNRARQHTSRDGVPFRSFLSVVEFDCVKSNARFVTVDFYRLPMWRGPVHQTATYSLEQTPHPMIFHEMTPNPTDRIIRAACKSGEVQSN